jgi:hypothetical protein
MRLRIELIADVASPAQVPGMVRDPSGDRLTPETGSPLLLHERAHASHLERAANLAE